MGRTPGRAGPGPECGRLRRPTILPGLTLRRQDRDLSQTSIPDDVTRLVVEHIDSLEQLEVLLLLHASPERDWTAEDVAREMRSSGQSAGKRLASLASAGILSQAGTRFRYAPKSDELDRAVASLARVYPERRFGIIELIFSKPSDTIRTFADAFRIRRDPE